MIPENCKIDLCIFCYKSSTLLPHVGYQNQRIEECNVRKFYRLLGRFVGKKECEKDFGFWNVLDRCRDCNNLIRDFCKVYHKIKCLELELLWKLDNLGNVMRLADRVPSRVKAVRKCFEKAAEEINQKDRAVKEISQVCQDGLKSLISIRMNNINKCFRGRKLAGLQPCVLVKRMDEDNESFKESKSIDNLTTQQNVFHKWIMSAAALAFLVLSSSSFDDNELIQDLTIVDQDEDIQESLSMPPIQNEALERHGDSRAKVEEEYLIGTDEDNSDVLSNIGEHTDMEVDIKPSPNRDFPTSQIKYKQFFNNGHIKRKFKQAKKVMKSTGQFRFPCALCKKSYSSYGGLRRHKNSSFHRFLKKKTLKVDVSEGKQKKGDTINNHVNDNNVKGNTSGIEKETYTKRSIRYNLRETRKKSYCGPIDDESDDDDDSNLNKNLSNKPCLNENKSTDTSSSETSDSDDNADIKPKISEPGKRTTCPETNCSKSFLTSKGLQTHVNLHGSFLCQFCEKSLKYAPDLAYHANKMHTDAVIIKQEVGSLGSLTRTKMKLKCSRCTQTFFKKSTYMHHFVDKHLGLSTIHAICSICQYPSHTESLKHHNLTSHFTGDLESSEILRCNQCSAYFRLTSQLTHHKLKIHDEALACTVCEIHFKRRSELVRHFDRVHPNYQVDIIGQFQCSTCTKVFTTAGGLSRHVESVHSNVKVQPIETTLKRKPYPRNQPPPKVTKFICSICALELPSGQQLANHEADHQKNSEKYLNCPRCKKYIPRVQYTGHFMKNHLGANQKLRKFQCEICEYQVTKLNLHHRAFHKIKDASTKIYKCEEDKCAAFFIKAIQLIRHMRKVHTIGFDCKYCGKKLKRKKGLMKHIKLLHPDKNEDPSLPQACDKDNCKKRFGTELELEWHQKWDPHDIGSDENKCKKCGNMFLSKAVLNNHLRTKCADPSGFICQLCGKGFKRKDCLKDHLKFHKGPDSFEWQCQTCGKKFINKYKLKDHMSSHTGEKRWICQWCGEKYGYRRSWIKHVMQKHKDQEGLPETRKIERVNKVSRKGARPGDCVLAGIRK